MFDSNLVDYTTILFASINSTLHVLLICFIGYVAAKYGIITPEIEKGLAGLIIKIFMPCLLFSNIGDLDVETLIKLWIIPVAFFTFVSISGTLGFIGGKLLRLNSPNTRFICTAIIFNNVTSLSLGLLKSLSKTKVIGLLALREDETPSEIEKRGISYVLLVTLWTNLLRWSLGTYLLRKESDECDENENKHNNDSDNLSLNSSCAPKGHDNQSEVISISVESLPPDESTPLVPQAKQPSSTWKKIKISIGKIINPPLCAALLAVVVGVTPFLKSSFFGRDAPLTLVSSVVESFGSLSVPLTLFTLGAQLKSIPRSKNKEMFPSITYVMTSRFIIMPIIALIIVLSTRHLYMQDPMLLFVLVMLACGPPAVNCMNLTHFTGTFKEEMATLLFYSYIAAAPMITLLVMGLLSTIKTT
ncbi:9041_t:CDS:2 [Acaulospora morrowiae]|uniref:9041_t:CDS:1 n=1 Tax=Acaulospora morrowiae TaxID=94023 RepID=A0A9N9CKH9_9GLOM|nr:9041_t:CDS:2 [Acaulospora morrowiae]